MTAIPLWEGMVVLWTVIIVLVAIFAVVVFVMALRNAKTNAATKAIHDAKTLELETRNDQLAESNNRLQDEVKVLKSQVSILLTLLAQNRTLTPAEVTMLNSVSQTNSKLLMAMQLSFSAEELEVLCFELGLQYANVPGTTLDTKIVNLISMVARLGRMADLTQKVKEARPQLRLDDL